MKQTVLIKKYVGQSLRSKYEFMMKHYPICFRDESSIYFDIRSLGVDWQYCRVIKDSNNEPIQFINLKEKPVEMAIAEIKSACSTLKFGG